MDIFNTVLVYPIFNILIAFYNLLIWLHVPFAFGFSIILLTVFIRLLMYPLVTNQLRMSKKMQELAPLQAKIKDKYKGDMKQQQQAQLALYREHGVNPAAGCLPGLVQIVILLFGLYPALMKLLSLKPKETVEFINSHAFHPLLHISKPFDTNFFGLALEKTPTELFAIVPIAAIMVPVLTGAFQFLQSKMMMPATEKKTVQQLQNPKPEDFMATFQKQTLYLLPLMIAVFSFQFSVGLSLYWNTYTVFGIIQQYLVAGWGGLEGWIKKIKDRNTK
jgi:YidC/Oxa1 family membrane protein insertase